MRIKMRSLMSFLGFAVGIFMLGDIFLFSNVGKQSSRLRLHDNPYHVGSAAGFLKRQIKSGEDYLADEGGLDQYDGVRDSVLGAMEVPGMKQKILPVASQADNDETFAELARLEQLERDMMEGRLQLEDEGQTHEEPVEEEFGAHLLEGTTPTAEENNEKPFSEAESQSLWNSIFNFGHKNSADDSSQSHVFDNQRQSVQDTETKNSAWDIQDMNAAGLDSSILSKLSHAREDQLFQKTGSASESEASPVGENSESELLAAELKQFKGMVDSLDQWQEEVPRTEQSAVETPADNVSKPEIATNVQNSGSFRGFFSSLFQPLKFAGSTGDDDEDDGGWASVGDLDNLDHLADRVNQMMVPGMNQKLIPQEAVLMENRNVQQDQPLVDNQLSSDPGLKVDMVAIPGFETDFFNKYGEVRRGETETQTSPKVPVDKSELSDRLDLSGLPADILNKLFRSQEAAIEVPPAVPAGSADAAVPSAEGGQPDQLQVPNIPGLTDSFFDKYAKLNDVSKASEEPGTDNFSNEVVGSVPPSADDIKVPNIPGLTDTFYDKYGNRIIDAEGSSDNNMVDTIQLPAIPGLTDDFFNKYGAPKPHGELPSFTEYGESRDAGEADVDMISADFFNKFIHPVAQGQAPPEVVAESFQGVPGLPEDFFNKFLKEEGPEKAGIDTQEFPDISGLEDYFNKYLEDSDLLPAESLEESLKQAQLQVPGMPQKIMPGEDTGPVLPEVPPSEYPEMEGGKPQSGVLSYLLSKILGAKKQELGEGLPVLPPGFNLSIPDEVVTETSEGDKMLQDNQTEEGFRVRYPGQDEVDVQKVLKALMINASDANETLGLADARNFLSQLEGVVPGSETKANESEKLANITSLEDSRVVHCNLTKSPYWKVAITDRWHTVQDGLMFVYSAYMDDRILGHTAIRILGILEGWEVGMHLKPYCQVWFQDKAEPFVVGATYEWLPGQPIAKFKAVLLTCVYQTSRVEGKPLAVSLTTEPCDQPKFLVKIHTRNETVGVKKTNFTVCLTGPMKFGYADVGQFIQWMEFNIMMGVERFVLYNHSMDAALRPYLVHYAKLGYVQLFPWIIPDNIPNPLVFLKNLGHLAMINDCLYRNMWTSKYVIFMDIDEMIMPRYGHVTFEPMLRNAGCHRKPQAVVQSVFFRREWPNDELYDNNKTVVDMGLVGLLKTKRERKIWPPYMRSKYFIKPDEVLICNVHAAHSFLSPLNYQDLSCIFNPKEVILHHYRYWGEVTGNYVVDRRLHEYADELITRAAAIYEAVLGRKIT